MPTKTIVFAIPSFNEADSIGQLTRIIDKGLTRYFKRHRGIILNVDNDSPDGTREAFLRIRTKSKKVYLSSRGKPTRVRGKGYHMRMAFLYAKKIKADAVGFVDGDVVSATPEWVLRLIQPVLDGYDHVLPIYLRNEFDGSITNHLVYPVLYGLTGADLRQPLAGEVALSGKAIDAFLTRTWYLSALHYGVDIFMVTESLVHNLSIAQTFLGTKSHKPSEPKLDPMFLQVADSMLRQLHTYAKLWKQRTVRHQAFPILHLPKKHYRVPDLGFDYKKLKESVLEDYREHKKQIKPLFRPAARPTLSLHAIFEENHELGLPVDAWVKIVYALIHSGSLPSRRTLIGLRTLFFARFLTFYKSVLDKTHAASEKKVVEQAHRFRALRRLALPR